MVANEQLNAFWLLFLLHIHVNDVKVHLFTMSWPKITQLSAYDQASNQYEDTKTYTHS